MSAGQETTHFPEPAQPNLDQPRRWSSEPGDVAKWLEGSTLPRAAKMREFLNRSLDELGPVAGANLALRFRRDPPFGRVFFEMMVGRFLQVAYPSVCAGAYNDLVYVNIFKI